MGELSSSWSPWRYLRENHPGIVVHEAELPPGYLGCTDHARGIVWLDCRLTEAERRATLSHELGHLELDAVLDDGRVVMAAEDSVDRWAARKLVPLAVLVRALGWSFQMAEIAEELWVDEKTLRDRFRCLTDEEQDIVMQAMARARMAA